MASAVVAVVLLAACGGGGDDEADTAADGPTSTAAPATAPATVFDGDRARAEVAAAWSGFFNPANTIDQAVAGLENGEQHRASLEQQRANPANQTLAVTIKNVQLANTTQADVTFDILLNGAVALADSRGQAKYLDGRWKVGEPFFCALLAAGQISDARCEQVLDP